MKEKQLNAATARKQYKLLKVKLQNSELDELKKTKGREPAIMYRMRKKPGLIKPVETPNDTKWKKKSSQPGIFIVNFEHIPHLVLKFLLLTLNKLMPAGKA